MGACLFRFTPYIAYITKKLIRSVSIKHTDRCDCTDRTDRTNRQHTVPWCHNEMRALHVLRIRTVSNSDGLYGAYYPSSALSIRTVTIRTDRTDLTNRQHTVPWCHNEMRPLHVLRIRTVSNADGLYGAYDPSSALSIRTVTIRTDRTDRTNRNTLCSDVIMRCMLRMCSEYGPLATLTVCTERTIRQLLLTVRNSATVLDMTIFCPFSTKNPAFQGAFWKCVKTPW